MCNFFIVGIVLFLRNMKVECVWGFFRSENYFWKDDNYGFVVKFLGYFFKYLFGMEDLCMWSCRYGIDMILRMKILVFKILFYVVSFG